MAKQDDNDGTPIGGLAAGAQALGLVLDSRTMAQFERLLVLLQSANATLNLTSVRDAPAIVQRHFLESLALGVRLAERGLLAANATVLDLGSGAGFPGLPLKLVWPEIRLTLVEATAKKADFLRSAVAALALPAVRVEAQRAEVLAHDPAFRETQSLVVARAVAALPALVELALPFLRIGGTLAAVKGSRAPQETAAAVAALEVCGGAPPETIPLAASGAPVILLVRKAASTPARYPRRPGQPVAHPIR